MCRYRSVTCAKARYILLRVEHTLRPQQRRFVDMLIYAGNQFEEICSVEIRQSAEGTREKYGALADDEYFVCTVVS